MKKYTTKPIDFTGCHPVIAEHLKQGEEIRCWAWDTDRAEKPRGCHEVWIVRFWQSADYPYRTATDSFYLHAEPIPIKVKRIMPPERAIPTLIENGWRFNQFGQMENGVCPFILPGAYQMMGCTLEEAEKYEMYWPPCIIEEVEDDE